MELRHLRWFIAVAEARSFRRAAERLHITQPPLSRGIQALEEELCVRLLDRSRNHVALTEAGAAFMRDARTALASLDEAIDRARRSGVIAGRVRISAVLPEYFATGPLAARLRAFRAAYPALDVEIVPALTRRVVRSVASRAADVGLAFTPLDGDVDDLEVRVVLHDRPVLALPPSHASLPSGAVHLRDVKSLPLVLFPRRAMPDKHDEILNYFHAAGITPKRMVTVAPNLEVALQAVGRGEGASVVPHQAASRHASAGATLRPIRGMRGIWNVVLIFSPRASLPARMLVDALVGAGEEDGLAASASGGQKDAIT